jgi:cysteine desulfurase / selenocysteine lyase
MKSFNVNKIRQDFPILQQTVHGKPLVYLDNAATAQKPQNVIDTIKNFYEHDNSNVHRAVHTLSERATLAYEQAREKVQHFINAKETREIIFTRGTTEAINLVAQSYGRDCLKSGDEIIISTMEHHSNIVPWQMLCQRTGAVLRVIPINDAGEIDLAAYEQLLNARTKLVAIVHMSNSLGTINPVQQIIQLAHAHNTPVLLDGAQAAAHFKIDVQQLDCDFYTCSSHKLFGPSGVGILYGKAKLLETMPPYQGGGDMISQVSFTKTLYRELPHKFEAGTPHISGVIGLGAAIDYLKQLDLAAAQQHEEQLLQYGTQQLIQIPNLRLIGTAQKKASILSFVFNDIHAHDVGTILDHEGVAVRTGHHCTMPLMERFNVPATVRASLAFYNTQEEINILVRGLYKVREIFK